MSFTLCTSGAAVYKAGANADPNATSSGAILAEWSDEVEGTICTITRRDWVTDWTSLEANYKPILSDLASDLIAMKIINYNMEGYTGLNEASTMLDVLRDNANRNLDILKLSENQEVL